MIRSLLLVLALVLTSSQTRAQEAHDMLDRALVEMGGRDRLADLQSMKWSGMMHAFDLVQSERPEGPFLTTYLEIRELRDLQNDAARREEKVRGVLSEGEWATSDLLYRDGTVFRATPRGLFPLPPSFGSLVKYEQLLAPIRVLLDADRSSDLRYVGESWLDGIRHHTLSFTTEADSILIFLNEHTWLPTAVDTFRPAYFDVWGTARHRSYFSVWFLEENGVTYPRQIDEYLSGTHSRSLTIDALEFDVEISPDTLHVPEDALAMLDRPSFGLRTMPYGQARREASVLPGGIVEVPGAWDVMFVPQSDGLVILEAPISSEHSVAVLEDAASKFPGLPIKAVVTTSDAWPHFSGLREYVARGIPVYALSQNRAVLTRLFEAEFTQRPDALELNQMAAKVTWVDDDLVLGEGDNLMVLFPAQGEGSERMLFAYFPRHRLLYASDMVQKVPDGSFFMPQYLREVASAIDREQLPVENVIAMHSGLTPIAEIKAAIPR